jgi:hypothetical protein
MEQKFEGTPQAEIRLEGRRVTRTDVTHDWGSQLRWEIKRNGQVIATPNARLDASYEHADAMPGDYEIVLQLFKYVNYQKDKNGEYTASKFIEISNKVAYKVG